MNKATAKASTPGGTEGHHALGIDVGGSGIKGAIVDLSTGEFVGDRERIETPQPATPEAVAKTVTQITDHFGWSGAVGLTLPGVVKGGTMRTAANIHKSWIGCDVHKLFADYLGDRPIAVLNDADAAGIAEQKFGGGSGKTEGLVILLTFGTGIGSALLHEGVLIPNSELGHLQVRGKIAERRASAKVREDAGLSWGRWAKRVSEVLTHYERIFSPDLFIAGGGVSRKGDKWIPLLKNDVPVVAAKLRNTAGIVGAAMAVDRGLHL